MIFYEKEMKMKYNKPEITLDYAISLMDAQVGELSGVTGLSYMPKTFCII